MRELGDCRGKAALDVGSGLGAMTFLLSSAGATTTGLEYDASALADAEQQVPLAKFVQGSALELPFPDASFDIVTFLEVIEHIPKSSEPSALAEIFRVLRSGGTLVLSTPNRHIISMALDPAYPLGHRHYSERRIRELLGDQGFSIKRVFRLGGFGELLGALGFYVFKWIFRREIPAKDWWDAWRSREYSAEDGFATVFAIATKP